MGTFAWVQADPSREIAVDALGLAAQADFFADLLLPEISVLTRRARYLSFFCWAAQRARKEKDRLAALRRAEGKLALAEAERHERGDECPAVVGRSRIASALKTGRPARPELLYSTTAFSQYRPLLRALGLFDRRAPAELTDDGLAVARMYTGTARPCLSEVPGREAALLRKRLGFDRRGNASESMARRAHTLETLGRRVRDLAGLSPGVALATAAKLPGGAPSDDPAWVLHCAQVWEWVSTGLKHAFSATLTRVDKSIGPLVNALEKARKARARLSFEELETAPSELDERASLAMGALRGALRLEAALRTVDLGQLALDPRPFELAKLATEDVREFVRELLRHHADAKGGDAWIELNGARIERLPAAGTKNLETGVGFHPYRLAALGQLAVDLGVAGGSS